MATCRLKLAPPTTSMRVIGLWVTSWIILLIVGVITWGLIIWAAVVYRRRKGQTGLPVQLRYNMPIEIFYTLIPFILVIGFFAFTARDQAVIEEPNNPDVTIEVYGKRWSWDFNYVTDNVYYSGVQAQETPDGQIDASTLPVLYLPVNQKVEIKLESRDVIHSFWIVDFLYKKDMVPAQVELHVLRAVEDRHLSGQVRRTVRRIPLAHVVHRPGRRARRLRQLHREPSRRRQLRPAEQ